MSVIVREKTTSNQPLLYLWSCRSLRRRRSFVLHISVQLVVLLILHSSDQFYVVLHVHLIVLRQVLGPGDGSQGEAEEARRQKNRQHHLLMHCLQGGQEEEVKLLTNINIYSLSCFNFPIVCPINKNKHGSKSTIWPEEELPVPPLVAPTDVSLHPTIAAATSHHPQDAPLAVMRWHLVGWPPPPRVLLHTGASEAPLFLGSIRSRTNKPQQLLVN